VGRKNTFVPGCRIYYCILTELVLVNNHAYKRHRPISIYLLSTVFLEREWHSYFYLSKFIDCVCNGQQEGGLRYADKSGRRSIFFRGFERTSGYRTKARALMLALSGDVTRCFRLHAISSSLCDTSDTSDENPVIYQNHIYCIKL